MPKKTKVLRFYSFLSQEYNTVEIVLFSEIQYDLFDFFKTVYIYYSYFMYNYCNFFIT